jgi:glycosyltransferase involved in cell wall biosynthesis
MAEKLNIKRKVVFYGEVSREKMIDLLKNAQVKIMLSNTTSDGDVEGFGIAVLEANAVGKPAIGSLNSGIEDAIQDGVTGKLVSAKDEEAIAEALKEILNNYTYYSNNALRWAKEHDWTVIIKQYIKVVQGMR